MNKLQVNYDLCDYCDHCIEVCPAKIIRRVEEHLEIHDPDSCMECQLCEVECPKQAIRIIGT